MNKLGSQVIVEASAEVKIPFHDVDLMAVAWHGHYTKYFEIARCALFDKIAYNYPEMRDSGYAWPIVDLHIRYPAPIAFGETLTISAAIVEWENRLSIKYVARNSAGKRTTYGSTVQVAVAIESGLMALASPPILKQKLAPWLQELGS
ncbi:acyl-CoA thioesterase [Simiduia curdlanivorans]|uniref:Acyl-CoA thioesterase n=1 Tax=Simiduia curdlanivorans TaxID=1492769 RepID=A0ABV8V6Z8_9GAMM|nr:acyl-CoA thioesterase [Simiduia curdlanivorans]MDN3640799.1 acyl-CoA thioesterase [Simiduia curdlanivorans]